MTDIRVSVPDEVMSELRQSLQLRTDAEVIQEALSLLKWASDQQRRNRVVLSASSMGTEPEQIEVGPRRAGSAAA